MKNNTKLELTEERIREIVKEEIVKSEKWTRELAQEEITQWYKDLSIRNP